MSYRKQMSELGQNPKLYLIAPKACQIKKNEYHKQILQGKKKAFKGAE